MLLVDAKNAFTDLNREATLPIVYSLRHAPVRILTNFYRVPSSLYMSSGKVLWSFEGTTQGYPLGMAMYAMGTMPLALIYRLQAHNPTYQQVVC